MSILTLLITLIAWPVGRAVDVMNSFDFPYYGLHEGNSTSDNENGEMDLRWALFWTVMMELGLIGVWWIHPTVGMLTSILTGVMSVIRGLINRTRKPKKRREQLKVLEGRFWYNTPMKRNVKTGRAYMPLFPWLYSTNPDDTAAMIEINAKLEEMRVNPVFPTQKRSLW